MIGYFIEITIDHSAEQMAPEALLPPSFELWALVEQIVLDIHVRALCGCMRMVTKLKIVTFWEWPIHLLPQTDHLKKMMTTLELPFDSCQTCKNLMKIIQAAKYYYVWYFNNQVFSQGA